MNDDTASKKSVQSQTIGLLSRSRNVALIAGIVFLILGIIFAFRPTESATVLAVLIAIAIFSFGFMEIADAIADRGTPHWGWGLLRGVVHFVIGAILIFWPDVTKLVIAILLGLDLIVDGIMAFFVRTRMPHDYPGRNFMIVRGILEIVIGIIVLAWPEQTLNVIMLLLAAYLIVLGAVLLLAAKRVNDEKKAETAAT